MSLITSALGVLAVGKIANSIMQDKKAHKFINNSFVTVDSDYFLSDNHILENLDVHDLVSLDGTQLKAYSRRSNDSNNYIVYVVGYNQKLVDFEEISNNFEKKGYNSIFIKYRDFVSYGIKESLDLLEWIYYFKNKIPGISFTLFGENLGANIIVKSLETRSLTNVKNIIVDNLKPTIIEDKFREYCIENDIKNTLNVLKNVKNELNNAYMFNYDEILLKNSLIFNEIPICFVFSKYKTKYDYLNVLEIYNSNLGVKKFFYTECLDRNFYWKNYFDTLDQFIKKFYK